MNEIQKQQIAQYQDSFSNCLALWQHYRHSDQRVLRCWIPSKSKIPDSLPVDFCCDVENIVRKTVGRFRYAEIIRLAKDTPDLIDKTSQLALGIAFERAELEEVYATLFWRAKQARDRSGGDDRGNYVAPEVLAEAAQCTSEIDATEMFEQTPEASLEYFGE